MSPEPHLDNVRAYVVEQITPLLPDNWDIKPGIVSPSKIAQPTLYCEYKSIQPLPEAPLGHARVVLDLTISTHLEDLSKGEDAVDVAVVELVLALDGHQFIAWSAAEKGVLKDTYVVWTVTVSTIANTAKTPEE